jgi:predicted site-specific integrase-resolvase
MNYVNTKEARQILRITATTLRRWDKEGKIKTIRTPSGIRLYDKSSIFAFLQPQGKNIERIKIAYCRVSSKKQVDDLERQKNFYRSEYSNYQLVDDIGSGINFKRKGLQTILELVMQGKVEEVVVSHRDRVCRFAFELIEWILIKNNTKLVVLDKTECKSQSEELAKDVLSIIHVFSCRENGKRKYICKGQKNKINSNNKPKKDT